MIRPEQLQVRPELERRPSLGDLLTPYFLQRAYIDDAYGLRVAKGDMLPIIALSKRNRSVSSPEVTRRSAILYRILGTCSKSVSNDYVEQDQIRYPHKKRSRGRSQHYFGLRTAIQIVCQMKENEVDWDAVRARLSENDGPRAVFEVVLERIQHDPVLSEHSHWLTMWLKEQINHLAQPYMVSFPDFRRMLEENNTSEAVSRFFDQKIATFAQTREIQFPLKKVYEVSGPLVSLSFVYECLVEMVSSGKFILSEPKRYKQIEQTIEDGYFFGDDMLAPYRQAV